MESFSYFIHWLDYSLNGCLSDVDLLLVFKQADECKQFCFKWTIATCLSTSYLTANINLWPFAWLWSVDLATFNILPTATCASESFSTHGYKFINKSVWMWFLFFVILKLNKGTQYNFQRMFLLRSSADAINSYRLHLNGIHFVCPILSDSHTFTLLKKSGSWPLYKWHPCHKFFCHLTASGYFLQSEHASEQIDTFGHWILQTDIVNYIVW